MAKKRVHEIAKAQGVSSKELLAALKAAGVEAKVAASSVEEADALRAIGASNGGGTATQAPPKATEAPAKAAPPAEAKRPPGPRIISEAPPKSAAPAEPKRPPGPRIISEAPPKTQPAPTQGQPQAQKPAAPAQGGAPRAAAPGASNAPAKKPGTSNKPVRPAGPAAGAGAGASGKKRRVVIDSQAARRDQMGGPPPQRPPRRRGGRRRRPLLEEPPMGPQTPVEPEATKVNSGATVRELGEAIGLAPAEVIKKLMMMGEMATLTQTLTDESIRAIADEYDRKIEIVSAADEEPEEPEFDDADEDLVDRPPVVTIMGHVDHGKTSLLDAIRETEVAAGEAGGITQHIGAYQVHHEDKTITFLDTPGHAAFTAMRARGAKVTDVVVVVVAADDGVMPQTKEAIDHARAADVPMIIAVNKIDKEGANPERVRTELTQEGIQPEEWGGETIFCDVSAKSHEGLDNLLENILLVTELEELAANPDAPASGNVIESQLDPGRGPVVTVLVQRGTLRVGDSLVAGPQWGRVRAMHDFRGDVVKEAVPGMPVEVLGFDGVADAGEFVQTVENDRRARQMAQERADRLQREQLARRNARKLSLEEVFSRAQSGDIKELNIVLKADVAGSLEALHDELAKVPQERVAINIIHSQAGGINESDVMLASASEAIIIGFNVRPLADARRAANREGVDIRTYSVIYKITEDLRNAMEGLLDSLEVEETVGEVVVKETFKASKVGRIAGCQVAEGKAVRSASVRLLRDGTVVWTGKLASLRRFKDDVAEVDEGQECGIVLDGYADVKEGDVIEFFQTKQVEQTLE
ncbi:MAG TPA: translation initiation factor IF-2 [Solirubrobacterales bacterium]|nr:translation initiation factor IF-2 [Solirubrobacterales bacterium]